MRSQGLKKIQKVINLQNISNQNCNFVESYTSPEIHPTIPYFQEKMAAFPSQEHRPLKKPRLGIGGPDVYPQDPKQKEVCIVHVLARFGAILVENGREMRPSFCVPFSLFFSHFFFLS